MDEMRKTILFCKGCVTNQLAFKILLTALDSSANEVATQEVKRKKKRIKGSFQVAIDTRYCGRIII